MVNDVCVQSVGQIAQKFSEFRIRDMPNAISFAARVGDLHADGLLIILGSREIDELENTVFVVDQTKKITVLFQDIMSEIGKPTRVDWRWLIGIDVVAGAMATIKDMKFRHPAFLHSRKQAVTMAPVGRGIHRLADLAWP